MGQGLLIPNANQSTQNRDRFRPAAHVRGQTGAARMAPAIKIALSPGGWASTTSAEARTAQHRQSLPEATSAPPPDPPAAIPHPSSFPRKRESRTAEATLAQHRQPLPEATLAPPPDPPAAIPHPSSFPRKRESSDIPATAKATASSVRVRDDTNNLVIGRVSGFPFTRE